MLASNEIVSKMVEQGVIPVFNHPDIAVSKRVIDACYGAGIRVFEFTNRDEKALDVFEALVVHAKQYVDLVLGIGTILSSEDATKFLEKGASFIVSPALVPEIAQICTKKQTLWIPGCGTATEIHRAIQLGAEIVKVFPGEVLGPGFVKSIRAVYPNTPLMPTGGVSPSEENLKSWFDAGVSCVGMGSQLIPKEILSKNDYGELTNLVKQTMVTIEKIRS